MSCECDYPGCPVCDEESYRQVLADLPTDHDAWSEATVSDAWINEDGSISGIVSEDGETHWTHSERSE